MTAPLDARRPPAGEVTRVRRDTWRIARWRRERGCKENRPSSRARTRRCICADARWTLGRVFSAISRSRRFRPHFCAHVAYTGSQALKWQEVFIGSRSVRCGLYVSMVGVGGRHHAATTSDVRGRKQRLPPFTDAGREARPRSRRRTRRRHRKRSQFVSWSTRPANRFRSGASSSVGYAVLSAWRCRARAIVRISTRCANRSADQLLESVVNFTDGTAWPVDHCVVGQRSRPPTVWEPF